MKRLLTLSPAKMFIVAGMGLLLTLGGFWHHQMNQSQMDRLNVLNQGVGTCFHRISQSFVAMMIRDAGSPYLHQGFMSLSEECFSETIKGVNPFQKNAGKGYDTLNQLLSESHWFHEKLRSVASTPATTNAAPINLTPISDRFSKIDNLRMDLTDQVETTLDRLMIVQRNDRVLMGMGLLIFVISLSLLSLQEFNRLQLQREMEKMALNFLRVGHQQVGAFVDQLVDRALRSQNMPVTAQVFRDYHEKILERQAGAIASDEATPLKREAEEVETTETAINLLEDGPRTYLKSAVASLQNMHQKNVLQVNDLRDVEILGDAENIEGILGASMNKFLTHRHGDKKIMLTNQVHSDRVIVSLFLPEATFSASELEFADNEKASSADGIDMNLILLKELVSLAGAKWHIENKMDRRGAVTGMSLRIILARPLRESKPKKNLVSVMKGKKKDLTKELLN